MFKMAEVEAISKNECTEDSKIDYEDLERMLSVVVQKRKTYPAKYMDYCIRAGRCDIMMLENARIVAEDKTYRQEYRKVINEFRSQNSIPFTLDDLNEMKQKLGKYRKSFDEINKYLEKRNMPNLIYEFNFDL